MYFLILDKIVETEECLIFCKKNPYSLSSCCCCCFWNDDKEGSDEDEETSALIGTDPMT